jgi:hypothetical protein
MTNFQIKTEEKTISSGVGRLSPHALEIAGKFPEDFQGIFGQKWMKVTME